MKSEQFYTKVDHFCFSPHKAASISSKNEFHTVKNEIKDTYSSIHKLLKPTESHQQNIGGKETTAQTKFRLKKLDITSSDEMFQLHQLRDRRNKLLSVDIIMAYLVRTGKQDRTFEARYGEDMILQYGGLQSSQISEDDLVVACTDVPYIIKQQDGVHAAYIYGSQLTYGENQSPTPSEKVLLEGKTCFDLLTHELICRNKQEERVRETVLASLKNNELIYTSNLLTSRHLRKQGLATLVKTVSFDDFLRQGKKRIFFRIFSVNGIYKEDDLGNPIYTFEPPIQNTGSLKLNEPLSEFMGIIPMYKRITDMTDLVMTEDHTRLEVADMLQIPESEVDRYLIKIDNLFFTTDIETALPRLKEKIMQKKLLDKCELNKDI